MKKLLLPLCLLLSQGAVNAAAEERALVPVNQPASDDESILRSFFIQKLKEAEEGNIDPQDLDNWVKAKLNDESFKQLEKLGCLPSQMQEKK